MNTALDTSALLPAAAAPPKEMLSWTIGEDGRWHFRINFSSLSVMQECQRKTEYLLIRKLRPNLDSPALLFGSAIHKGLETFYRGKRTQRVIPSEYREIMQQIACGRWESAWSESLLFCAAYDFVTKAEPLKALPDDNKRSIFTGVWMLQHYMERYLTDEYVVYEDDKGPIVERGFTFRLGEEAGMIIDVFGTIDFVMKNEVTGQILPGDHKTASSLYDFYDMCKPNHQYTIYTQAANKVFGLECDSFLINALQVKAPPKTSKGSPPDFARQITTRTADDFEETKDAITLACLTFRANHIANTWPLSAPGPCSKYGGCSFREVCAAPKELRENIIQARFASSGGL